MKVELLADTKYLRGSGTPEELVEHAGRVCYRSMGRGHPAQFIMARVREGHTSIIEHARLISKVTEASAVDFLAAYQVAYGLELTWREDGSAIFSFNAQSLRDMVRGGANPLAQIVLGVVAEAHPVFFQDLVEKPQQVYLRTEAVNLTEVPDGSVLIGVTMSDELSFEELRKHGSLTFDVGRVSRVFSHQQVRHRVASYSQESQRYVDMSDPELVVPPEIAQSAEAMGIWDDVVRQMTKAYQALRKLGIKKEDARFLLPNATATRIVVTMDFRELRHFFRVRCDKAAQWEIRAVAMEMLKLAYEVAPAVFQDLYEQFVGEGSTDA